MTVGREHPTCPAMSVLDSPSAASSRILARSARAARIEPERLHWPRVRRSSGDIASGGALAGMSNRAATTPQPSSKFRDDLLGWVAAVLVLWGIFYGAPPLVGFQVDLWSAGFAALLIGGLLAFEWGLFYEDDK